AGRLRLRPPRRRAGGDPAARAGAGAGGAGPPRGPRSLRAAQAVSLRGPVRRADALRGDPASPLQRLPRRRAGAGPGVGRNAATAAVVSALSVHRPLPDRDASGQRRIVAIAAVVLSAFLVVIGQLWYLQVLEGGRFLDASDKNRIRVRPVAAPRGILFDRHGVPLVDNRPAFTLSLIPRELDRDPERRKVALGRVAALLGIPYRELEESAARVSPDSLLPVRVRRGLPP